jgi:hypothetical protein
VFWASEGIDRPIYVFLMLMRAGCSVWWFNGTYRWSFSGFAGFAPDEASAITPGHDGLGHFAGGLVDRLAAKHDRAALADDGGM